MRNPCVSLRLGRKQSPSARVVAGALAALLAAHSVSAATHTWDAGDAPNTTVWSTDLNWSDDAGQTFAAGDTFDLSTLDITADSFSTVDASATLGIINIGDATTSSNPWTLDASGWGGPHLNNGGTAQINQTSTGFGDIISVPLQLANPLKVTTSFAANTLSILGGITAPAHALTKDGVGNLVVTGNNNLNTNGDTSAGPITVQGGVSDGQRSTLEIPAGMTTNWGDITNRGYGSLNIGTGSSGFNTMKLNGGQLRVGQVYLGADSVGYNALEVSTPGTTTNHSLTTGRNAGQYLIGMNSSYNSMTISNGAVCGILTSGGTDRKAIGDAVTATHNSVTVTGTGSGWRALGGGSDLIVGNLGSNNSLSVNAGGYVYSRRFIVGAASSDNQVLVDGEGSTCYTTIDTNTVFQVGATANAARNSWTIQAGAASLLQGSSTTRAFNMGAAAGADDNYVRVTGVGSLGTPSALTIGYNIPFVIGGTSTADGGTNNHIDVYNGSNATFTSLLLRGTASRLNLGNGTAVSNTKLGTTATAHNINLLNADSVLKFNKGRLTAETNSTLSAQLVFGLGQIQLAGDAYISVGVDPTYGINTRSIDSSITGSGRLIKEGDGILALASGTNSYSGNTTVSAGTLELTSANPNNETSTVTIPDTNVAVLYLNFEGTDTVGSLVINDVTMDPGIYDNNTAGIAGTGTLTVSGAVPTLTYASWAGDNGIPGAPAHDDADNDAVPNAVEMVLGGDPNGGMDAGLLPELALVTDPGALVGDYLEFTYRRTALSVTAGVTAACEYGTDLVSPWLTAVDGDPGIVVIETPNHYDTGIDRVQVYVLRNGNAKLFGRLQVTVPAP